MKFKAWSLWALVEQNFTFLLIPGPNITKKLFVFKLYFGKNPGLRVWGL